MIDPDNPVIQAVAKGEQLTYARAVWECGSNNKAAKMLGKSRRTIDRAMQSLQLAAARQGWSPEHNMTKPVPDGFHLKGTSTLYDEDGNQKLQWVKSSIDHERQRQMMQEAFEAMGEDLPRQRAILPPRATDGELLNCYVITDFHLGALAWGEETGGDDWDIKIAEDLLVDWFSAAIKQAPKAQTAVFAQLGDFLHWDGLDAVTPTNRHILDADTRFAKLVRVAIRAVRRVINILLSRHEHVHVLMAEGNHDLASSVWLREWLAAIYSDEPRITVDNNPDPYYCYEHGLTSLFFHHGHKKKLESLDEVFAAKFREVFGRTQYSYVHTGHLHHKLSRETTLMVLEQHRTLAAPDSHSSRGGWLSKRAAQVITYHKQYGEVGRVVVTPEMLKEGAA